MTTPIRVFFSYAHEDDRHRTRLAKALKLLEREGLVEAWSDRKILPGDQWEEEIDRELERAELILLLVSDDFLASDYCWGVEVKRAMEREQAGEAKVVPIIVRPSVWETAPFAGLQALPADGKAVTGSGWKSEDEAWAEVIRGLRELVRALLERASAAEAAAERRGEGRRPARPDPTRYLEAVDRENAYVEIRGMGAQVAERLPLDCVYTRLRVAGAGREGDVAREKAGAPGGDGAMAERHLTLPEVLRHERHAVLVGDPGSGKTTFLRFAAQVLARSLLAGDPAPAARELGLPVGEGHEPVPFPVLVRLSRFAEFLHANDRDDREPDVSEHFLRYLEFVLRGQSYGLPETYLRRRVEAGGCFLLLDGLDEVPGRLRPRVAAIAERLLAAGLGAGQGGNRYLLTCRTRAYRGEARLGGVSGYPLAPFGAEEVASFVDSWSRALFQARSRPRSPGAESDAAPAESAAAEADRYRDDLLEAIRSHPNVGPMTESPLMLTMLAVVHWNQKKLPERRNELYDAAVEYLLESREEQSPVPGPLRKEALQALALAMFTDEEGVQRSFGMGEAAKAVADVLAVGEAGARTFLDEEALRSGLLVSRSEGEVEFWHLSFQEYLAALELESSGAWWEVVGEEGCLHDDRWNEVVLLLAGCLRRRGGVRAARRFVEKILATGTDRVSTARAAGLVGKVLVDLAPYGGDASAGTDYRERLEATLGIFEPGGEEVEEAVRVEVGEALGQSGDPRLAKPEENRVEIPGGTFLMGAQKEDPEAPNYDPQADDDEAPVHRVTVGSFVIGRYPVMVQEFRAFVEAGDDGYLNPRLWHPKGWAWREREEHEAPGSWKEQRRHPSRPVVEVSWYETAAYCRWVGGRLPTEAEWEFAARGEEGRRFPWGAGEPDRERANFAYRVKAPTPVGIYPGGATPEGVEDMAGNVYEWCADWFGEYRPEEQENPTGPESGASRVVRGGAFGIDPTHLRASVRDSGHPGIRGVSGGFRVLWSSSGGLERL